MKLNKNSIALSSSLRDYYVACAYMLPRRGAGLSDETVPQIAPWPSGESCLAFNEGLDS